MLELGLKTLLAYLLGSIIGSLLVGMLRGGVDIRTMGSGNAGGTNALRRTRSSTVVQANRTMRAKPTSRSAFIETPSATVRPSTGTATACGNSPPNR